MKTRLLIHILEIFYLPEVMPFEGTLMKYVQLLLYEQWRQGYREMHAKVLIHECVAQVFTERLPTLCKDLYLK